MNRSFVIFILAFAAACDENPTAPPAPGSAAPAPSAVVSAAPATPSSTATAAAKTGDVDVDTADVPVAADFEDDADKAIDDDNLEMNVDKLDKDIVDEK